VAPSSASAPAPYGMQPFANRAERRALADLRQSSKSESLRALSTAVTRPVSLDFLSSMALLPSQTLLRLFNHPQPSPLEEWVGESAALTSQCFLSTLQLAFDTFSKSSSIAQCLAVAASMPQLDPNIVLKNDQFFLADPLGAVNARADEFAFARISDKLKLNIHYPSAPPELKHRLDLLIEPLSPIYDPQFKPDIHSALARQGNSAAAPILSVLVWKSYEKGECLLVSRRAFTSSIMAFTDLDAHLSHILRAEKLGDIGRLCYDYKSLPRSFPINGGNLKPLYIARYGKMILPTYKDYLDVFYDACDAFPGEPILIAKSDLSRFYHRARWSASSSLLMSVLVSDDLVAVPITHGFGKGEIPYVYSAYSDFCDHCHLQRCRARGFAHVLGLMYSDDFTTFGSLAYLRQETADQAAQISSDIHPEVVNLEKVGLSPMENVLGIRTDTSNFKCGLSHKSFLKLCYLFFILIPPILHPSTLIPLHTVQSLASLCYYNGQYFPLCRSTGSIFFRALRGYSCRPRTLSKLQIECVCLWRSYLIFAFTHATALSSPMYDVYHNNPHTYPITKRSFVGPVGFTDADLYCSGAYIPSLGFCQVYFADLADCSSLTIAHYELLAFIIAFLLAIFLNPQCAAIHIHIDNQNALAWSSGRIGTNDQLANVLSLMNCFLQVGFNMTQTRCYIASKDNVQADQISRRSFTNYENLTQYYPNSHLIKFLRDLVNQPDRDVSQILQSLLILLDYDVSCLFVSC